MTVLRVLTAQKQKRGAFRLFHPLLLGSGQLFKLFRSRAAVIVLCLRLSMSGFLLVTLPPSFSGGLFLVQAEGDFSITSSVVF